MIELYDTFLGPLGKEAIPIQGLQKSRCTRYSVELRTHLRTSQSNPHKVRRTCRINLLLTAVGFGTVGVDEEDEYYEEGKGPAKLWVKVGEACNIMSQTGQWCDTSVWLEVGGEALQTSVCSGTANPIWNEEFVFKLARPVRPQTLRVTVVDKSTRLGSFSVQLDRLPRNLCTVISLNPDTYALFVFWGGGSLPSFEADTLRETP